MAIGAVVAYLITTINPSETSDTNLFLFFAGALAICAMILPGISGSFILVIIGAYSPVLEALNTLRYQKNCSLWRWCCGWIVVIFKTSKMVV